LGEGFLRGAQVVGHAGDQGRETLHAPFTAGKRRENLVNGVFPEMRKLRP